MTIPDGLSAPPNLVCRLKKSLYGLKQASRQWFARLTTEMFHEGFVQSRYDSSLFIKKTFICFTIAAIYVDDIILTGNNPAAMRSLKSHLDRIFSIKDLGPLNYFLGLEVSYISDGIVLTQNKYTQELLRDCGITAFHKAVTLLTPLPLNLKLQHNDSPLLTNATDFRCIVGKAEFFNTYTTGLGFYYPSFKLVHEKSD